MKKGDIFRINKPAEWSLHNCLVEVRLAPTQRRPGVADLHLLTGRLAGTALKAFNADDLERLVTAERTWLARFKANDESQD